MINHCFTHFDILTFHSICLEQTENTDFKILSGCSLLPKLLQNSTRVTQPYWAEINGRFKQYELRRASSN